MIIVFVGFDQGQERLVPRVNHILFAESETPEIAIRVRCLSHVCDLIRETVGKGEAWTYAFDGKRVASFVTASNGVVSVRTTAPTVAMLVANVPQPYRMAIQASLDAMAISLVNMAPDFIAIQGIKDANDMAFPLADNELESFQKAVLDDPEMTPEQKEFWLNQPA